MKEIFGFLSWINNVSCALTLTLFILFNRRPAGKETLEENFVEKQQFRAHWIIMAFWLLGTIVVGSVEINVLWVVLFVIVGAFIASSSKSSVAAFQLAKSRNQNPDSNSERHKANTDVGVYCTNCGVWQQVTACFCSACGAGIATAPFAQPSQFDAKDQPTPTNTSPKPQVQTKCLPDLGKYLAGKGVPQNSALVYNSWEMDDLAIRGRGHYCTTIIQPLDGNLYCATFDFGDAILTEILARATIETEAAILSSLSKDRESIRQIPLLTPINTGVVAVLGNLEQGMNETFIPLQITEVFGLRRISSYVPDDISSAFVHKPEFITPKQIRISRNTSITDNREADKLFRFGQRYYHGQGVPRILAEAASYYRKSAELGHSKAQLNLGALYENGEGVPRDHKEACFWMALSSAYNGQQFDLSGMGLSPKDLSELRERASRWFAEHQGE
jgi:hypothetical protein